MPGRVAAPPEPSSINSLFEVKHFRPFDLLCHLPNLYSDAIARLTPSAQHERKYAMQPYDNFPTGKALIHEALWPPQQLPHRAHASLTNSTLRGGGRCVRCRIKVCSP